MKNSKSSKNGFAYNDSLKKSGSHISNKFIKINKYLYRPIASLIVRLVYHSKITPNTITFISSLFGMASAYFFFRGETIFLVLGGISLQLYQILDCVDGMLARARNICSDYGAFMDQFLDRIIDFLILTGISVGLFHFTNDSNLFTISIFTIALYFLQVSLYHIINKFLKKEESGESEEGRALMILAIFIFSLVGRLDIFIYLLFAETILNILVKVGILIQLRKP